MKSWLLLLIVLLFPVFSAAEESFNMSVNIVQYKHNVGFYVKNTKEEYITCDVETTVIFNDGFIANKTLDLIHITPGWYMGARMKVDWKYEISASTAKATCIFL